MACVMGVAPLSLRSKSEYRIGLLKKVFAPPVTVQRRNKNVTANDKPPPFRLCSKELMSAFRRPAVAFARVWRSSAKESRDASLCTASSGYRDRACDLPCLHGVPSNVCARGRTALESCQD